MKIRFKRYTEQGFFKKDKIEICEGLFIGCVGYQVSSCMKIWYNNKIISVEFDDVIEVAPEQ